MNGLYQVLLVAVFAVEVLAIGQGSDVARVLANMREALGGETKLSAVTTVMVEGTRTRVVGEQSRSSAFELAMELPGRFMRKDVMGNFNGMELTRTTGFNGADLIERSDTPPQMAGGGGHMTFTRIGGGAGSGASRTPEQMEADRVAALATARKDFARFALGMFGGGFSSFPLEFAYGGTAESGETKAHILTVTGPDAFEAKLFVDSTSNLPLMLSWMDKEPLTMQMGGGPMVIRGGGPGGAGATSAADVQKMRDDMERQMAEAEAKRRTVEHRLFYAEYKDFSGIKLPTRLQRMIDGNAIEELSFDKVKVNGKLDAKLFNVK